MSCSTCTSSASRMEGHFGAYTKAGPSQIFTSTGPVVGAPNETAGMHVNRITPALRGLGTIYFGEGQTNLISGVANEYLAGGAALLLIVLMMR